MNTYICILRGINVSGKNIIKMADLKQLFEAMGFINVKTYIQSGNVIFESKEQSTYNLGTSINEKINSKFGYNVPVLVKKSDYLRKIVATLPFSNIDTSKLYVTFLSGKCTNPPMEQILEKKGHTELIHIEEETVYIYCPDGYGKTKLSNNFLEKKLQISATTRNWKTVNKLLELAS
jgi:uncharacterized protein (DUF1697 family)